MTFLLPTLLLLLLLYAVAVTDVGPVVSLDPAASAIVTALVAVAVAVADVDPVVSLDPAVGCVLIPGHVCGRTCLFPLGFGKGNPGNPRCALLCALLLALI